MRKPTVHLNGTSLEALKEGYWDSCRAVHLAISALSKAYPNGRDYYVQGEGAFTEAAQEHYDRIRRLESVYTEINEIYQYLDLIG
jgi:hypothetical protein